MGLLLRQERLILFGFHSFAFSKATFYFQNRAFEEKLLLSVTLFLLQGQLFIRPLKETFLFILRDK